MTEKTPFTDEQLDAFASLFTGNESGYGQSTGEGDSFRFWVASGAAGTKAYREHLNGKRGLSISPIRSDNMCLFGVIDDDEHHRTGVAVNINKLALKVKQHKLPLVPCRSRTGGVHLYVFFEQPTAAAKVRTLLKRWAGELGIYGDAEIFPKQIRVPPGGMGNTIGLPYCNAASSDKYLIIDKEPQPLSVFLSTCEKLTVGEAQLKPLLGGDHAEAPPCLQRLILKGCPTGCRNEALYNLTIYMKRKAPTTYTADLMDLNRTIFDEPMNNREAQRTIKSAARSDYRYRCNEAPCRNYCDRDTCSTRKFGIDIETAEPLSDDVILGLRKHLTQPIQWELQIVGDKRIFVQTSVLLDYRRLMTCITEGAGFVPPGMKNAEWLRFVAPLVENAELVSAPTDSTVGGVLLSRLADFIQKARESIAGDKSPLLRGNPIYVKDEKGRVVTHFRGKDFMEYLKRKRHEEVRPNVIWISLKQVGVKTGRFRIGNKQVSVWSIYSELDEAEHVMPRFEVDF